MATKKSPEENLAEVRAAMEAKEVRDQIRAGGDATEGVPINYTSVFGNTYKGFVVFKRPDMLDMMKMGGKKSQLFSEAGVTNLELVDDTIRVMAHVIATLSVVLVKRPEWLLDLNAVKEPDVLYHIFAKYEEWENSFRKASASPTS